MSARTGTGVTEAAILSYGFRPFFLLAGGYAVVAIALWLAVVLAGMGLPLALPPSVWHAHEMLFGFAGAGLAGFVLTAVPSWTDRAPPRGAPLLLFAALWLAGRLAATLGGAAPPSIIALIDALFPAAIFGFAAHAVLSARNRRNYPVLLILALYPLAALLSWPDAWGLRADRAVLGQLLALFSLVILITVIGGRIVPLFTGNWLKKAGRGDVLPPPGSVDKAALGAVVLAAIIEMLAPGSSIGGAVLIAAGGLVLARLTRWRGLATLAEPIVAVLHLGYGWLGLGLILLGLSSLTGAVPRIAGIHALSAGAIATMLVAVMSRASLGHTGRALTADRATVAVYALVTAAAIVRVLSPWLPEHWAAMTGLSGGLWIGGFALFTAHYWPVWTQPRLSE